VSIVSAFAVAYIVFPSVESARKVLYVRKKRQGDNKGRKGDCRGLRKRGALRKSLTFFFTSE
jgi:hypothetical protein